MLLEPGSHLLLLRLEQQRRDRDLRHRIALRDARHDTDARAATTSAVSSLRRRLVAAAHR